MAIGLVATGACSDELTQPRVGTVAASDSSSSLATSDGDRAVLVALYTATNGPRWSRSDNWLTDAPLDEWYGVSTTGTGERVGGLSLPNNDLTGELPSELGKLTSLGNLLLNDNNLTGRIPPELGKLANLVNLFLDYNDLTGEIPSELGKLTKLGQLYLNHNDLSGEIPPELGELSNLTTLWLDANELTGEIPRELGHLADLRHLALGPGNQLTGEIPPELGKLTNLGRLRLSGLSLTGEIPSELGYLTNLEYMGLSGNLLTGEIPPELGNLASLEDLWLNENDLTGQIPAELGNLTNLKALALGLNGNLLTGEIPPELGNLTNLTRLWLNKNDLTGDIPPELGQLVNLGLLSLSDNDLTGEIPPELGNLANLHSLDLYQNDLTGDVPPELGNLANLQSLSLSGNFLTGLLPQELVQLGSLRSLTWSNNAGLCAPGTSQFMSFVQGLISHGIVGPFCHEADAAVLRSIYHSTHGSAWDRSDGWMKSGPLTEWHGVWTDSAFGRVVGIDLSYNGLSGHLVGDLASLELLRELKVAGNSQLGGRLAERMTALSLRTLSYDGTRLCVPSSPAFNEWLRLIPSHSGHGTECPPLADRDVLEILYGATDGASWVNQGGWLTDAPLGEWHGVRTDKEGRVVSLALWNNGLTGRFPPELGGLTNLTRLVLNRNDLTGEVPHELGNLAKLAVLDLGRNDLTGEIPLELGYLTNLEYMNLSGNLLTGEIPSELGNLDNLEYMNLSGNLLTGEIPSELGNLDNLRNLLLYHNHLDGDIPPELGRLDELEQLWLDGNALTGRIPPEIGNLAHLRELLLDRNQLTDRVPAEFGNLASLRQLALHGNAGLSGALPSSLANISGLSVLSLSGTRLCAPDDFAVRLWLRSIRTRYVPACQGATSGVAAATAYVVQTVQSADVQVPLVAGRPGLLRVFATVPDGSEARLPSAWATFYQPDGAMHSIRVPSGQGALPAEMAIAESSLSQSSNIEVPGRVLRPGVEMVVVLDPEGDMDPGLGVPRRIPATGRMALEVYEMPAFDLTVVPFVSEDRPDSLLLKLIEDLTAEHWLFESARRLLPVGEMSVTIHEPVWTSIRDSCGLLHEVELIRVAEGATGYHMGTGPTSWGGGCALRGGKSTHSGFNRRTVAHEFGHNLSLGHAPCGGLLTDPDPAYPHARGAIGTWGYDPRIQDLVHPSRRDIMSYCYDPEISDYHFANALRWRLHREAGVSVFAGQSMRVLLLWGGVGADGSPFLNPAFVVDAIPSLPDRTSAWRIVGEAGDGRMLFSQYVKMTEILDGDGGASFAVALPAELDWADALSRIVLTGPGGAVEMDAESARRTALLRNAATGRVRGILWDWPLSSAARTSAGRAFPESGLDVQVSAGVPRADAWWH